MSVAILFFYIQVWNYDFVLFFSGLYLVPFGLYVRFHALKAFTFVFGFYVYCFGLKNWKKAGPLFDSDLVCYCLSCHLCGFAFLFVLMSKKFWLCIWFLFIPSILLHFSFPVTLNLFFLGFAYVCCYFVLLYPGLKLRFCSSFSRFVFCSFWPLCSFSCVKSFHLCIWFGFILLWTGKKRDVCLILILLSTVCFASSMVLRFCSFWCLKSFYLCIWFLFYSLYFFASFFFGYSLPFFLGFC